MSVVKGRKNFFSKIWDRFRQISSSKHPSIFMKISAKPSKKNREGCFSVYVGRERQKFVMKIKYANHILFRKILQEAELEYGFRSEGPLLLPCEVDVFRRVLAEILLENKGRSSTKIVTSNCGFAYSSLSLFNSKMAKGYCSYRLLSTQQPVA